MRLDVDWPAETQLRKKYTYFASSPPRDGRDRGVRRSRPVGPMLFHTTNRSLPGFTVHRTRAMTEARSYWLSRCANSVLFSRVEKA